MINYINYFNIKGIDGIEINKLKYWNIYFDIIKKILTEYNYIEIKLPLIEKISLFGKFINNKKKLLSFKKKIYILNNNLNFLLNPEGTIPCIKYCIKNNIFDKNKKIKLWYFNPTFRYENTQFMRYREFYQLGIEIFGYNSIEIEIELIYIINLFFTKININKDLILNINMLGDKHEIKKYCLDIIYILKKNNNLYDISEIIDNLKNNNLSILNSKKKYLSKIIQYLPKINDYIDQEKKKNFDIFINFLKKENILFKINHFLFRGINYYNNGLIYEWRIKEKEDISICSGGRYDNILSNIKYNKNISSLGLAIGWNRLIDTIFILNKKKDIDLCNKILITSINFLCIYTMLYISNVIRTKYNNISINLDYDRKSFKKSINFFYKYKYNIIFILYKLKNNNIKIFIKKFNVNKYKISSIDSILKDINDFL